MVMLELEVVLRQDAFIVVVEDDEADAGSGWDFCLCNGKKIFSICTYRIGWCYVFVLFYNSFAVIFPKNPQRIFTNILSCPNKPNSRHGSKGPNPAMANTDNTSVLQGWQKGVVCFISQQWRSFYP